MQHEQLLKALRSKGFETLSQEQGENKLVLHGRVTSGQQQSWLLTVRHLLITSAKTQWKVDISRKYLLVGDTDPKLVYAVRVIISGPVELLSDVASVVANAPRPQQVEIERYPLHANPNRNVLPNGGGVSYVRTTR